MEDKTKFGFIFKVLFIHRIPLSFRKLLINSNPEMSSVDDSSHQYNVETILCKFIKNNDNLTLLYKFMKNTANNILKEGRRSLGDLTDVEAEVTKPVKRLKLNVIV